MCNYDGFNQKRLNHLQYHINESLDILKQCEDQLREASDPLVKKRSSREINRQKDLLAEYKREYNELKQQWDLDNPEDLDRYRDSRFS